MGAIGFRKAKCKDCYKCVRLCPVKAIITQEDHVKYVASECVLCGRCLESCPQNAITVFSDIDRVKTYIDSGEKSSPVCLRHILEFILTLSRDS